MSNSGSDLPPLSFQEGIISAVFNSAILDVLLFGIYTTVYLGTVYIYLKSGMSRNGWVLSAVTILYLSNVVQGVTSWLNLNDTLHAAETSITDFYEGYAVPDWGTMIGFISTFTLFAAADGLLIWRCYNVWDRSFRVVIFPLVLLIGEIGAFIALLILLRKDLFSDSDALAQAVDDLIVTASSLSLATTLLATLLIAYRIRSATHDNVVVGSKGRYMRIVDMIVQSSAFYALALVLNAVQAGVPTTFSNAGVTLPLSAYAPSVYFFVAGMAPTVMVARVALASFELKSHPATAHISDLEFGRQSISVRTPQVGPDDTPVAHEK